MNTYILIYEGFANFEVVIASLILKGKGDVITISVDDKFITSYEGFKFQPHIQISEININDMDVLLIPGGDPKELYGHKEVYDLIQNANKANVVIGAICAGPIHLAKAGILQDVKYTVSNEDRNNEYFDQSNYEEADVVVSGNIITSKPSAYVDFAIELGKKMSIFNDESAMKQTEDFFKNYKCN